MARPVLQRSRLKFTQCPDCGYDVRKLPEPTCPECGRDLTLFYKRGRNPWWVMLVDDRGMIAAMIFNFVLAMPTCLAMFRNQPRGWFTDPRYAFSSYTTSYASITMALLILSLLVFGYFHDRIGTDSWIPQILWAVVIYSLTAFHLFGVCSLYL